MKRKLFAGALLLICLSLLVGGTWAYFTQVDTAHNVITSGEINIDLLEWANEGRTTPFPASGLRGLMPGTVVTKIVEVKNTGTNDAFLRMKVERSAVLDITYNTVDWTARDGYYYFNKVLKPGETTPPLFSYVALASSLDDSFQNTTAYVDVTAYAVQADHNSASALTAAGWPE